MSRKIANWLVNAALALTLLLAWVSERRPELTPYSVAAVLVICLAGIGLLVAIDRAERPSQAVQRPVQDDSVDEAKLHKVMEIVRARRKALEELRIAQAHQSYSLFLNQLKYQHALAAQIERASVLRRGSIWQSLAHYDYDFSTLIIGDSTSTAKVSRHSEIKNIEIDPNCKDTTVKIGMLTITVNDGQTEVSMSGGNQIKGPQANLIPDGSSGVLTDALAQMPATKH